MNVRMILVALILMLTIPNFAVGAVWGGDYNITNIGKIQVRLMDDATDGCWTNIKEVKVYAEDKLEMIGADVMPFNNSLPIAGKENTFDIEVGGSRFIGGFCHGMIHISLGGFARVPFGEKGVGLFRYSDINFRVAAPDNFNNEVLNAVKKAIEEWEERN